jgi:methylated-DNA-[protein]-cysteine S-methyltransferase
MENYRAVTINWVELESSEESVINVTMPTATLFIYKHKNIITRTKWCFEITGDATSNSTLETCLNNKSSQLILHLQTQGSIFRRRVWSEICKIPVGEVITYSQLAQRVDSGARAVANACRDNPFPGVVPCHRIVAMSGLGGYMGETSGKFLELKRGLLASEAALI